MEHNIEELFKMRKDRDFYFSQSSKILHEKLDKCAKSIMVGSLSIIEEEIGFLWGHGQEELTEEQLKMLPLYENLRTKIFDNGNSNIKKMEKVLEEYNIGLKNGSVVLPVKQRQKEG